MHRYGVGQPEGVSQCSMPGHRVDEIIAAQDMGDLLIGIINDHGMMISPETIGPPQNKIISIVIEVAPAGTGLLKFSEPFDRLLQGLRLELCRSAEPRIENFSIGIVGGLSMIDRRLKSFARAATGVGSALRNQAIECRLIGRVTLMLKQDPLGLRWVLECIQSAVGRIIPAVPP